MHMALSCDEAEIPLYFHRRLSSGFIPFLYSVFTHLAISQVARWGFACLLPKSDYPKCNIIIIIELVQWCCSDHQRTEGK